MKRTLYTGLIRRGSPPRISIRHLSTRNHLDGLNGPQRQAVEFSPKGSLQILAGPGTGKTRVLTSRVANLILSHSYSPSSICAVTFTRKAAREMRERLKGYIGAGPTEELKLGTFHSVCANYLRTYGLMVHVGPKFLIWDDEECGILIRYIAESLHKGFVKNFPAGEIYEMFSTAKEIAKIDPKKGIEEIIEEELRHRMMGEFTSSTNDNPLYEVELILQLFYAYSRSLKESNALDFTDLLTKGLDLFRATLSWARDIGRLEHVLVDELHDTSSLQYLIIKELFKATKGSISVYGNEVYSWRGADNTVFEQMKSDLPRTKEVFLEENYRSTASNIAAAINIISQGIVLLWLYFPDHSFLVNMALDKKRPPKTLFTSHTPSGPRSVKKEFALTDEEEDFVPQEINRLLVKSNGVIGYGDCAILFRTNNAASEFARALRKAGVPYRVLPELSLNDRIEVKNLLAFLRLAIDDAHTPMLIQAMTGPFGVQEKVVTSLIGRSIEHHITLFDVLERLQSELDPDTTPPSAAVANTLIRMVQCLRALMEEGASPVDLIHYIIEATNYYAYLRKEFGDGYSWRARNVQQTIRYARNFRGSKESGNSVLFAFLDFMRDLSRANDFNTGTILMKNDDCFTSPAHERNVYYT
ncbi:unnamed protein product [Rhizoctonia solani]|uniref:DNA 3'-5' helicase n=1 Tax=Rhizoctonia solani TaxID=456999 RepID=A0A8H3D868_9AGAM|nr:unnamed protein product [Rhizoctonia solani]